MINFFSKFSFVLSQKRQFFAKKFGENIMYKIITSVPDHVNDSEARALIKLESRRSPKFERSPAYVG
jgi:hypothetical protein